MISDIILESSDCFCRIDFVEEILIIYPGISSIVLFFVLLDVLMFYVMRVFLTQNLPSKSKYLPN